jgi:AraC-like DNA-binding protein
MLNSIIKTIASVLVALLFFLPDISLKAEDQHLPNEADSMLNVLGISPDRLKPKIYLRLSDMVLPADTFQAIIYARQASELATELKILPDQLMANHQLSKIYFHLDSLQLALQHAQEALRISEHTVAEGETQMMIETLIGESLYYQAACYQQLYTDSVQAIVFNLTDALKKLRNTTQYNILADAHRLLGQQYLDIKMFDKGVEHLHQAIDYYEIIDDKSALAYLYMQISYRVDRVTGIQYAQKAIELYAQANDSLGMARNLVHIAYNTRKILDPETNLGYLNLAYSIYEKYDDYGGMVYTLFHLATYHTSHLIDSSAGLSYLKKGAEIALKHEVIKSAGHVFITLGSFYKNRRQYDSAAYYMHVADSITALIPGKPERIRYFIGMGDLQVSIGRYQEAEDYLTKALQQAEKIDDWQLVSIAFHTLYTALKNSGNFKKALYFYEQHMELINKMINQSTERAIADVQIKYETSKMEHALDMMKKSEALKNAELQRKQMTIYSISAGLLLILAFSALLGQQYLVKRRAYEKLMEKNLELINSKKQARYSLSPDQNESSQIDPAIHEQITKRLNYQIKKNKIFLKRDITLNTLAKKCGTNSSYLSKVIHLDFNTNFSTFINEYRIREAQIIMADERYKSYSIEGISSTVGFKTKSVFNNSFKKFTGVTPSYYLEYLKDKKTQSVHLPSK